MDKINLNLIRETFGRVVWTHKTYEKEFEIQEQTSRIMKIWNLIILSIGSTTLVGTIITNDKLFLIASAIITTLALALAIFQMSFNPEERAFKYKQTAAQLWLIREKYACLIGDIMNNNLTKDQIIRLRDQYLCDLDLTYKNALPTSSDAYSKASTALKVDEEYTFSDREINKFLPKELWINN
jgi:hypothetical protein